MVGVSLLRAGGDPHALVDAIEHGVAQFAFDIGQPRRHEALERSQFFANDFARPRDRTAHLRRHHFFGRQNGEHVLVGPRGRADLPHLLLKDAFRKQRGIAIGIGGERPVQRGHLGRLIAQSAAGE